MMAQVPPAIHHPPVAARGETITCYSKHAVLSYAHTQLMGGEEMNGSVIENIRLRVDWKRYFLTNLLYLLT